MSRAETKFVEFVSAVLQEKPGLVLNFSANLRQPTLQLLFNHFLAGRYFRLRSVNEVLPPELFESLRFHVYRTLLIHAEAETTLCQFAVDFTALKIPMINLKGWLFARRFYRNPTDRYFQDLDLLFPRDAKPYVIRYFNDHGYREVILGPRFAANENKIDFQPVDRKRLPVECHFDLGYDQYRNPEIWQHSENFLVSREKADPVALTHLSLEDEFTYMLFHATIQHRLQKLGWLMDFQELILGQSLDFREIEQQAQKSGLDRALSGVIYFLQKYAGLPATSFARMQNPPTFNRQQNRHYDLWFKKIACGRIEGHLYNRMAVRALFYPNGWRDAFKYSLQHTKAHWIR